MTGLRIVVTFREKGEVMFKEEKKCQLLASHLTSEP